MITEALGIRGWGPTLDRLILTSIITGDPLLMLSNYGQGKTALVDRFGQVLLNKLRENRPDEDLIVAVVNAATANPQDWAGYFVPVFNDDNKTDVKMELLESPLSLINAIMIAIDEISRAASRNQNNILSLVQERRVDGIQTKCEILFAMMNPVIGDNADEGSEPLIGALADRFALLIEPPSFSDMTNDNKKDVVSFAFKPNSKENIFEAPGDKKLGKSQYVVSQSVCDSIWDFLVRANNLYTGYCFDKKHEKLVSSVVDYVSMVTAFLMNSNDSDFYISGRRAGMITRSILANIAIGDVLGDNDTVAAGLIVLSNSMINKAMGKTFNGSQLHAAHNAHAKLLKFGGSAMSVIMSEPNKRKRLSLALKLKIRPDEFSRVYVDFLSTYESAEMIDEIAAMALIDVLPKRMSKHEFSKIVDRVISVTKIPSTTVSLNVKTRDDVVTIMEIQNTASIHKNRILALCAYSRSINNEPISKSWGRISTIYDSIVKLAKEAR